MIASIVGAWTEVAEKSFLSSFPPYSRPLGAQPSAPPAEPIDKLIKASRLTLHLHADAVKNSNFQRNQGAPCPHVEIKV